MEYTVRHWRAHECESVGELQLVVEWPQRPVHHLSINYLQETHLFATHRRFRAYLILAVHGLLARLMIDQMHVLHVQRAFDSTHDFVNSGL
jgi:hypothetical protein